jgi:hypothetical protein
MPTPSSLGGQKSAQPDLLPSPDHPQLVEPSFGYLSIIN